MRSGDRELGQPPAKRQSALGRGEHSSPLQYYSGLELRRTFGLLVKAGWLKVTVKKKLQW